MRRALVGSAVLLLTAGFAAAAQDRWLHVKVVDAAKGGESVNVNVPLELAEKVLPTIQAEKLSHGKIKIEGEIEGVDIHALLDAVRTAGDNEFVTVNSPKQHVRVAKSRGYLLVQVRDEDQKSAKVDVTVPISVVDALFSGGKDELDLVSAVRALKEHGDVRLVTVEDGSSKVRIWVDSKNTSE